MSRSKLLIYRKYKSLDKEIQKNGKRVIDKIRVEKKLNDAMKTSCVFYNRKCDEHLE